MVDSREKKFIARCFAFFVVETVQQPGTPHAFI